MSFALTTRQIKNRQKTVTRRFGWWFLKPGDIVNACEKCMGLRKGEKVNKLCRIRITDVRKEPLNAITKGDCIAEGFPDYEPADFVAMLTDHYGCEATEPVNRIEFVYVS
ncbi:hypothetical protein [Gracilimonas tropica]|uniref:hypothetical protein n=1 Tax=Gracilimonas tropica TaxID=454600 RepID=UPI00038198EC|nr:hypothetical protein [Gracilimonas tropica]